MCYTISQPVYFTWQYVIRYHNQCISPGNVLSCTTTSVFHLAMYHTLPRPARYHVQCLSSGNVSYGTMTSAFHMAMCHTVPRPVPFTWQCIIRYHNQCNMTMRHMVTQPVYFTRPICHTVPRPVSFTWQCVIRYHDQRLSHGTKVESSTPSSDEVYFVSDLRKLCDFLRIQLLRDDI